MKNIQAVGERKLILDNNRERDEKKTRSSYHTYGVIKFWKLPNLVFNSLSDTI